MARTDRRRTARVKPAARLLALLTLITCADRSLHGTDPRQFLPVERVRVDGEEHGLTRIRHAALRSDGAFAVDQRLSESILFFSRAGDKVGEFGRRGQGPGEFRGINGLGWTGDTLWVADMRATRLTRISGLPDEAVIVSEVPIAGLGGSPAMRFDGLEIPAYGTVRVKAVYPGGDRLLEMINPSVLDDNSFAGKALYTRVAEDGSMKMILAHVDRPRDDVRVVWNSDARLTFGRPWVLRPSVAVSADGQRLAVVTPMLGEDRTHWIFNVAMLDEVGDTLYRRQYPFEAIPIPEAVADSAIGARLEGIAIHDANFAENLAGIYRRNVDIPPIFPPFGTVFIGADDRLWIQQISHDPSRLGSYLVLNMQGDLVGEVLLPASVLAADANSLWQGLANDFGIPILLRYDVPWHNTESQ